MVFAPVINRIKFLTMVREPSVAIKGGTFASYTRIPLNSPTRALDAIASKMAIGIGTPFTIPMATITPESPTTEPTEISIPDEVMTNTIPIAMMP